MDQGRLDQPGKIRGGRQVNGCGWNTEAQLGGQLNEPLPLVDIGIIRLHSPHQKDNLQRGTRLGDILEKARGGAKNGCQMVMTKYSISVRSGPIKNVVPIGPITATSKPSVARQLTQP